MDGYLLAQLEARAKMGHSGLLTITRFDNTWWIGFGILREAADVQRLAAGHTFSDAARTVLSDPTRFKLH